VLPMLLLNLGHFPGICLQGLKKATKVLSQDNRPPVRDLSPGPLKYEVFVMDSSEWSDMHGSNYFKQFFVQELIMSSVTKTEFLLTSPIFCDIKPCSPLKVKTCFDGKYCLHFQSSDCHLLHAGFSLVLFF
jgi:hypothetical protein